MNMTDDAELEIGGSDPIVGTRDHGVLDVGDTASGHSITDGPRQLLASWELRPEL